ncbi:MAG: CvpA family protein [Thermodesulfobacteriota bacterium]|nr:CvpA family protein [Thermodesulfobacteriota bacterium]
MNIFDIIIVAVISFCLIRGAFRGIIREASSIVGVLAAFYGAFTYYPVLALSFEKWISTEGYRNILSFFILFCLVIVIVNIVASLIRYLLKIVFLGWVDMLCGMIFGAVKGVIIISVLFIIATTFLPKGNSLIADSFLAPHVAAASEILIIFVPKDIKKELEIKVRGIKKIWEKQKKAIHHKV